MFNKRSITTMLLILSLAIFTVGCGGGKENVNDTLGEDIVDNNIEMNEEQIFNNFIEKYPGVKVNKIALKESGQSQYVYEIEGYDDELEYEEKIDAESGQIIEEDQSGYDSNFGEIYIEDILEINDYITKSIADADEGFMLKEWEIDMDEGLKILEIELVNDGGEDIDYKYDLDTGRPVENE